MNAKRTPIQTAFIEMTVARMKFEIVCDAVNGLIPRDTSNFGDLHDHVDANEYGGFCEETIISHSGQCEETRGLDLIAAMFPDPEGATDYGTMNSQAGMDACNEMQNAVDAWLREGGLTKALAE